MDDEEIRDIEQELEDDGLEVDYGHTVGGPFIDDGDVRIFDPETLAIYGVGDTLKDAYDEYLHSLDS